MYASHIIVALTSPALWTSKLPLPTGPGLIGVVSGSGFASEMWRRLSAFLARLVLYANRRMPKNPGSVMNPDCWMPPAVSA